MGKMGSTAKPNCTRFLGRFDEQGVEIIANFYTIVSGNVKKRWAFHHFEILRIKGSPIIFSREAYFYI